MDRKRQLDRKFADYYSRSFGFARINEINILYVYVNVRIESVVLQGKCSLR